MAEKITEHDCVVCPGKIVEVTEYVFDATLGPAMIGPGSKGQSTETTSYHCGSCGIKYTFPPKPGTKAKKE